MQEPDPRSRRIHAGHHLANKQAPARLIPKQSTRLGFDVIYCLSTTHLRFTLIRLHRVTPDALKGTPFPVRSAPTALNRSTLRWFAISACTATTEGLPPSPSQHRNKPTITTSSSYDEDCFGHGARASGTQSPRQGWTGGSQHHSAR